MVFLIRIILHVIPQVFLISPKKRSTITYQKTCFQSKKNMKLKLKRNKNAESPVLNVSNPSIVNPKLLHWKAKQAWRPRKWTVLCL